MAVSLFSALKLTAAELGRQLPTPLYQLFLIEGEGSIEINFARYTFSGCVVLFTAPYQAAIIKASVRQPVHKISFHADYYCIEYRQKEVACNGLLFNNIYGSPLVVVSPGEYGELQQLYHKMRAEHESGEAHTEPVVKSCLQLFLAIASKVKLREGQADRDPSKGHPLAAFQILLEQHYLKERAVSFYADQLAMSVNAFTKKCHAYFLRTPSRMIQDRVALEAKKLLHLTRMRIKEIAGRLDFEDEHYFSRFFKKNVGVSPTVFRRRVGISIVADLSTI